MYKIQEFRQKNKFTKISDNETLNETLLNKKFNNCLNMQFNHMKVSEIYFYDVGIIMCRK